MVDRIASVLAYGVIVLSLLVFSEARGERPLQTEDAGVLDPGACQLQSAFARVGEGGMYERGGYAQFGCGISKGTQVQLAAGQSRSGGSRVDSLVFTGKTAVIALTDDRPGLSIAYSIQGAQSAAQSMRFTQATIKAVYSEPVGAWLVHGNIGWARDLEGRRDSMLWNVAVERPALRAFDWVAELYGDDRVPAWAGTGGRWWLVDKRIWVDASYALQLGATRSRLLTVGISGLF